MRMCRAAGAAAAAAAAAGVGWVLSFPSPPHAVELGGGRVAVSWAARAPRAVQAFNHLARPWRDRLCPVSVDGLIAGAQRQTGLSDFGDESAFPFRDGLERYVAAYPSFGATPFAQCLLPAQLGMYLATRLRAEARIAAHPQILDEVVDAPVFIVGLPRTGTTHLLGILAEHPGFRPLPLYEAMDPVRPEGLDLRATITDAALWLLNDHSRPLFHVMHQMGAHLPHEDIHLLAVSFASWLLEASVGNDIYGGWYESTDLTPAYRYFRRLLQLLQWQDRQQPGFRPRRWLLKTPMHSEHYGVLLKVFPDARVVATHRDPLPVLRSYLTLITYGNLGVSEDPDGLPRRSAAYWAPRIERMLNRSVHGRRHVPPAQAVDVRFGDLVADNLGVARRVCDQVGAPLDAGAEDALRGYIHAHSRARSGALRYDLSPFGLSDEEWGRRFRFYRDRFGVSEETA